MIWGSTVGQLSFEKDNHNFGKIKGEDGMAKYVFQFTNEGPMPVRLTGVDASCGCTTPSCTRDGVPVGGTGTIVVLYNPVNRPGVFRKSLRVNISTGGHQVLYINGEVIPRPKTIKDELPVAQGALRFSNKTFAFGTINENEPVTAHYTVYNESDNVIKWLQAKTIAPRHTIVAFATDSIAPKEKSTFTVTFDPKKLNDLGFVTHRLELFTDEAVGQKVFSITANVIGYFPEQTMGKASPRITVDSKDLDLGRFTTVANGSIFLSNQGSQDLEIRKVETNCGCIITSLNKLKLKPGEQTELAIKFEAQNHKGRQYKTITLHTNDPINPALVINIRGEI